MDDNRRSTRRLALCIDSGVVFGGKGEALLLEQSRRILDMERFLQSVDKELRHADGQIKVSSQLGRDQPAHT